MANKMGFSSYRDFLSESHKYKLGFLPTEQSHPDTWNLSRWSQEDLPKALQALKSLDDNVFSVLQSQQEALNGLSKKIYEVFNTGGRVFLCGCGATGRLSLLIESLWNREKEAGKVVAFMAGGDIALVQSVEGFEDHTEFGQRQLEALGFGPKDLLISSTEGGETPFVIGATLAACKISQHSTYYLYCNPTDKLIKNIPRSREVIEHSKVVPVELFTGSMAVAGSTRMQASTILQAFISLALLIESASDREKQLLGFINYFSNIDMKCLIPFIEAESAIYSKGERITYQTEEQWALNVFTDTTERAPTFSMKAFDHPEKMEAPLSLSYIVIKGAKSSEEAWCKLLSRKSRALDWSGMTPRISQEYLQGFDFSARAIEKRNKISPSAHNFQIYSSSKEGCAQLSWSLNNMSQDWSLPSELHLLWHQLLLKTLLNTHSTLVMGRLGRYENNLMTWVKPSNGKLIDRTARYITYLLEKENKNISYDSIIKEIFSTTVSKNQSMVLAIFHLLKDR